MAIPKYWLNFGCLLIAIGIYSLFSFPFPRAPGAIELVIGLLLVLAAGLNGGLNLLKPTEDSYRHGYWAFWYLFMLPSMLILIYGWEARDFIRDFIPLIYLFIPLFILPNFKGNNSLDKLPLILSLVGLVFSLRFFHETQSSFMEIGGGVLWDNKKYYSYDPSVLFGAIWFATKAFGSFKMSISKSFISSCYLFCSFICFAALAGVLQRAPIGLLLLSIIIFFFTSNLKLRYKVIVGISAVLVSVAYLSDAFVNVFELLYQKQLNHGLNNKDSEFDTVIDVLSEGSSVLAFGLGWGGVFFNPAYGMIMSNTHSLLSYALIKTGLVGTIFFLNYAIQIVRAGMIVARKDIGLALACASSLIIGLAFQPTYKTLTYGVILLIIFSFKGKKTSDAKS